MRLTRRLVVLVGLSQELFKVVLHHIQRSRHLHRRCDAAQQQLQLRHSVQSELSDHRQSGQRVLRRRAGARLEVSRVLRWVQRGRRRAIGVPRRAGTERVVSEIGVVSRRAWCVRRRRPTAISVGDHVIAPMQRPIGSVQTPLTGRSSGGGGCRCGRERMRRGSGSSRWLQRGFSCRRRGCRGGW
jgi:hypothetical protein